MKLREYQANAVDKIKAALSEHRSTLLVAATGSGKTVMFSNYAWDFYSKTNKKILVIAHMRELLEQAASKFYLAGFRNFEVAFDIGSQRLGRHTPPVVMTTKQTLERRIGGYKPDTFGLIIHDESDYATSGTWDLINKFPSAKVLGATATPERTDGERLLDYFDSVADIIDIRDLIEWGFLVPIESRCIVAGSIELDDIRISKATGDFSESDINKALEAERAVLEVASIAVETAGSDPTIVFCSSIRQANDVTDAINSICHESCLAISGENSDNERDDILRKFSEGKIQFLCNCVLLTRGIDLPFVRHMVNARPTKSLSLYTQCVGRVLRLHGATYAESVANGKARARVTDITGVSKKHRLITSIDVLAQGAGKAAVAVRDEVINTSSTFNPLSVLKMAEERIRAKEEEKIINIIARSVRYKNESIDPFTLLSINHRDRGYDNKGMTEAQVLALTNFGFTNAEISTLTRGRASALIANRIESAQEGGATYKQIRTLAGYGLPRSISKGTASKIITLIASNKWRLTDDMKPLIKEILIKDPLIK